MSKTSDMEQYYRERAPVYDRVYQYPERQVDLRFLESHIPEAFINRTVLEVAAGTGYWTQFIAGSALKVLATDLEQAPLDELLKRDFPGSVETRVVDAYQLSESIAGKPVFDAAFIGLWLSHVPKQRLDEFFLSLHRCLKPGATVVMLDNSKAQCDRLPISHYDEYGNSYQNRTLDSGAEHQVLKNFPSQEELQSLIEGTGEFKNYIDLENFWLFQYTYR